MKCMINLTENEMSLIFGGKYVVIHSQDLNGNDVISIIVV